MWLYTRSKCELKFYLHTKVKLVQTIQTTNWLSKDLQQLYTTPKTKVHIQVTNHICLPLLIQHKTEILLHIFVTLCMFLMLLLFSLYVLIAVTVKSVWPVDGPSMKILRCWWSANRMNKCLSSGMMWIMRTCRWTGRDGVASLHCRQLPVRMTLLTANIGHHTWNSTKV